MVGNVSATVFEPLHSDFGEDTDSDGDFNYLVVDVVVNVSAAGNYTIFGSLEKNAIPIVSASNTTFLNAGIQVVQLRFIGWIIRMSGENGPYIVELDLFDENYSWLDSDSYETNNYQPKDFDLPPAAFSSPHSDFGLDTNGDGYFEYLVVNVVVDVSDAGFFNLYGKLFDSGPKWIGDDTNYTYLDAGIKVVQLYFNGMDIYNNGVNDTFTVYLDLEDDLMNLIDSDIHTTGLYTYDRFQPPPALFKPPHSDYGVDTDNDGFFNYLVVNVTVNVSVAGFYEVVGNLFDNGSTWIDNDSNYTFLNTGTNVVQIRFSGMEIYKNGENGPYTVELELYNDSAIWLNLDEYNTSFYSYDQFQPPPALLKSPHSGYGLDTDGDGLFNYLVVNVTVNVSVAGDYRVEGELIGPSFKSIELVDNFTFLNTGIQVVQLYFTGSLIYNNGKDGSFMVKLELFDDSSNSLDTGIYITGIYDYIDFQPPAPPPPPTGLQASLITGGKDVMLSWNASADDGKGENDVVGYTVYKSVTGVNGTYDFSAWINATGSTSYDWTDINAGDGDWNDYFYIVRANDSADNEEQNNNKVGKFVKYLEIGWNLISVPLIQNNTTQDYVMQTVDGNYAAIQGYHAGKSRPWLHWQKQKPSYLNSIEEIPLDYGYYVYATSPDHLIVAGKVPTNTQIILKQGWNLVSYPCLINKTRNVALSSIDGKYNAVLGFDPAKGREALVQASDNMSPGLGYWIHATENCVWVI